MSNSDTIESTDPTDQPNPAEKAAEPTEKGAEPAEKAAEAPEKPAEAAEKAAEPARPKNQLIRRVEARIALLEGALERLGDDPAKQKQARAIQMALKGARDSMNLGADRVSSMESQLMARWLESTQYLVPSGS